MYLRVCGALAALAVAILAMAGPAVAAPTKYHYQGPNFTSASGIYSTSMSITGQLTFDAALAPNIDIFLTPASHPGLQDFSFSDGINTITFSNTTDYGIRIITDGSGNISDWRVDLQKFNRDNPALPDNAGIVTCTVGGGICGEFASTGAAGVRFSFNDLGIATNTSAKGTWAVAAPSDLAVSISESSDPVQAGSGAGNLTYVVTASNTGSEDAFWVEASRILTLPSGVSVVSTTPSAGSFAGTTWTIGNLASGASETLTVVLTVGGTTASGTDVIGLTSVVASTNDDTDASNNGKTERTSVGTEAIIDLTRRAIRNYLLRRADLLLSLEPRLLNRFGGPGFGPGPFNFTANGLADERGTNIDIAFSTSLGQISAAREAPAASLTDGKRSHSRKQERSRFDIWLEASMAIAETGDVDNSIQVVHVGADYQITPKILIGIAGQIDQFEETTTLVAGSAEGLGWMIGPYAVYELAPGAYLDARVSYGGSDNEINAVGIATDDFQTERFLFTSHLSGVVLAGPLRLTPTIGVRYFEETQETFVDALGHSIPSQRIALGRMTFGPEVAYAIERGDTQIEEFISFVGFWDFERAGQSATTSEPQQTLRARVEAGFTVIIREALQYTGSIFYDGIFTTDHRATGLRVAARIPF